MSETYIINGQVYVGRRFQRKTISVEAGKIHLMDPDVQVSGDVIDISGRKVSQCLSYQKSLRMGAQLLGIHLEGPFLASQFKGAMPEHLLKKGSLDLLTSYQEKAEGNIRYITVSPEVEGVLEMIPALKELGITVAIGHSGADYERHGSAAPAPPRDPRRSVGVRYLL